MLLLLLLVLSVSLHIEGATLFEAAKFSHKTDKLAGVAHVLIRSTAEAVAELEVVATGLEVVVEAAETMHSGLARPSGVLHILANFLKTDYTHQVRSVQFASTQNISYKEPSMIMYRVCTVAHSLTFTTLFLQSFLIFTFLRD